MDKFLAFNGSTNTFEPVTPPVYGYEYEVHFDMPTLVKGKHQITHYMYCMNFNELTAILEKLKPLTTDTSVRLFVKHLGDVSCQNEGGLK